RRAGAAPHRRRGPAPLLAFSIPPAGVSTGCEAAVDELTKHRDANVPEGQRFEELIAALERSATASRTLVRRLSTVAQIARELFDDMDFAFLFDSPRKIFSIGYRAADGTLDPSDYDLLASEARLASFIAIAKGDVPVSHW